MRFPILPIVLCLITSWPAAALDLPARRPGLWEVKVQAAANVPALPSQQCIDANTDRQMQAIATGLQDQCKQDVRRSGGTMTIDSVCKVGSANLVSQAVVTGDFDKAYTVRVTSRREGDNKPAASVTIEARWLGACRPGQQPGDIIIAGQKMNYRDLQKLLGAAGSFGGGL